MSTNISAEKGVDEPEAQHLDVVPHPGGSHGSHPAFEVTAVRGVDESFKFTFGKMVAILSFVLGYFSDTIVIAMASAGLQDINKALGPSVNYTWIVTSFTVGGAALAPVVGRLGDIFGRRIFLLAGNLLGVVGTVTAATANSVDVVIAGGVLIGIASSMRQLAWASLGEIVPKKSRGLAFGLLQLSLSFAQAFGPVIAFTFVEKYSWRPIYWLPFALDASALLLVFFFYRPMNQYIHEEGKSVWGQLLEIDYVGTFLFVAGIVLFLAGISFGGGQFPWTSAGTIAPIVVGFCLLVACGFYEAYMPQRYPIFPPVIFRNVRGFTVLQVATFLLGMLFYAIAVLWPTQVQSLYATKPFTIGWFSSAGGFGGLLGSLAYGLSQRYLGHTRWQLIGATAIMTICCACMATSSPTSSASSTALVVLTLAFVSGLSVLSVTMIQVGVAHEYLGVASGVIVTARSLGGAVATTIYLSVLNNRLATEIPKDVGGALLAHGVKPDALPAIIEALSTGDATSPALGALSPQALSAAVLGLKDAYAASFRSST